MEASFTQLAKGKTAAWSVAGSGEVFRCGAGELWLTRTGDPEDHMVGPGELLILLPGRWVAQALEAARFQRVPRSGRKEVVDGQAPVLPVFQRM